jgi:hypothetical protein
MMDFEEARVEAFKWIKRLENVRVLTNSEAALWPKTCQVWEIDTEISHQNVLHGIQFQLVLLEDFPLSIPKVFLSDSSFAYFKYLPHTQSDRFICTYPDNAQPDPNQPGLVVEATIRKAKQIIVDGLSKKNANDYEEEFAAYWAGEFEKNDKVLENVLLAAKTPLSTQIKLMVLHKDYAGYRHIVHQDDEYAKLLREYFEANEIKFDEVDALNVGELPFKKPPFALRNKSSLTFVEQFSSIDHSIFKKYLNDAVFPKAIVFSKTIGYSQKFFGWFYKFPSLNRNGFRSGKITVYKALTTFNANDFTQRFNVEDLSLERLSIRSAGMHAPMNIRILSVAGVGSVGSNLVHFLNGATPEFRFIDDDRLKVENIGRHLLGFEYVGEFKTKSLKKFLLKKNPLQKISTRESSIIDIIRNVVKFLNDSHFLFVAIGKSNIERWIVKAIADSTLTTPTFLIWVEPYLAGGHCIFINRYNSRFNEFFDARGDFAFNVIDQQEYLSHNPKLSAKEAGCQTAFVPYSSTNTILFLSSLFPHIINLMEATSYRTTCFSWVGDLKQIKELHIRINPFYENETFGKIIEHNI